MVKHININKTKQKILEAAEKMFSEKGYDAVSVEDITKAAGITKSNLFYYFEKKQDILYTLMEIKCDKAMEHFMQDFNDKDKKVVKEDIFGRCALFVKENKDIFRIALFEFLKTNSGTNIILELPKKAFEEFEILFEFTKKDQLRLIATILRTVMFSSMCDNLCEVFDVSEKELEEIYREGIL